MFEKLFGNKVELVCPPVENQFKSVTVYTEDSKKGMESCWSCANHSYYGIKGWKSAKPGDQMTRKQVSAYI